MGKDKIKIVQAMIKMEIDQKSLNRTIRELAELGDEKHNEAAKIVETSARTIESKAKKEHIFKNRTGRLQGGIHTEKISGIGQKVETNVDYAEYVHDGTSKITADPFLQRPFYQEKPKLMARLKKLVDKKW